MVETGRRSFIKKAALASAGIALSKYISPSLELFAVIPKPGIKHVVLCILSGGVRRNETVGIQGMSLMPHLFGNNSSSVKSQGTLFTNCLYSKGEITHCRAISALISGTYGDKTEDCNFQQALGFGNEIQHLFYNPLTGTRLSKEQLLHNQSTLTVIQVEGADIAHSNYSAYCAYLQKADQEIYRVWQELSKEEDTVMIIVPDHGRNEEHNSITDENGIGGLDHYHVSSRDIFCLITGPANVIEQNRIISKPIQTIDVLPTIADLLKVNGTKLEGRILSECYKTLL